MRARSDRAGQELLAFGLDDFGPGFPRRLQAAMHPWACAGHLSDSLAMVNRRWHPRTELQEPAQVRPFVTGSFRA